jgi:predicted RNase H-like nuclease (RuvC/YqgF family)
VIDQKNRYTALHYAVKLPNNDIVEYLMNCGADTTIKQNEGKDSIDLSIEANKRFLVNKVIEKSNKELDELYVKYDDNKYNVKTLERKNKELTETNEYLQKANTDYANKIDNLKKENVSTKRKLEDSEKAFENLLKKNRK